MSLKQTSPKPDSPATLLCASWIAPMDQPAFRDGAILIQNGRIISVGNISDLRPANPSANIIDLPGSILLPGLVNAHTHLELSDCKCAAPPADGFVQWIQELMMQTRADENQMPAIVARAIDLGVKQCLRYGVTTVGDISKQCHLTRPLLRNGPLRVVSYGEVQSMAKRRHLLEPRLSVATNTKDASDHLTIGISPHAPYSVEPAGYRRCLDESMAHHLPFATHLSETPFEKDFLNSHIGPFSELWAWLNMWDVNVPRFKGTPVQFAASLGLLDHPTLLAHVNYCTDEDLNLLRCGKASVVYCPRTHKFFQHPPHRWLEMIQAGINVAVGTDSCASSPDLNVVDDLRLLHEIAPQVPPEALWELATIRAARAIRMENSVGSLTVGKLADVIAFKAVGDDPLESILTQNLNPLTVWIGGTDVTEWNKM